MLRNRLIPVLLLHDGGLWKSERFRPATYVGDPTNAVRIFNDKEVDELILLDVDAAKAGRGPDFGAVERIAAECFMPLCYGGGVRSAHDAERLLRSGVEKIALGASMRRNPELVGQIAERAGSQAVVAVVDVRRGAAGLRAYDHATQAEIAGDWTDQVKQALRSGAGEVLVMSVDRDGTLSGPDVDVARRAAEIADVPVIYCGGVRDLDDVAALTDVGASAVAAGAMFVYFGPYRAVLITYPDPAELRRRAVYA